MQETPSGAIAAGGSPVDFGKASSTDLASVPPDIRGELRPGEARLRSCGEELSPRAIVIHFPFTAALQIPHRSEPMAPFSYRDAGLVAAL